MNAQKLRKYHASTNAPCEPGSNKLLLSGVSVCEQFVTFVMYALNEDIWYVVGAGTRDAV